MLFGAKGTWITELDELMTRIGLIVAGVIVVAAGVLLSFAAHERPVQHIEKQIANVTITG